MIKDRWWTQDPLGRLHGQTPSWADEHLDTQTEGTWWLKVYNSLSLGRIFTVFLLTTYFSIYRVPYQSYNRYHIQIRKKKIYTTGNKDGKYLDHYILTSHSLCLNRPKDAIQQNRETGEKPILNLKQYTAVGEIKLKRTNGDWQKILYTSWRLPTKRMGVLFN